MDIAHGLVGKTAIHPDQISVIEEALKCLLVSIQMRYEF